jgi:hypothetical protein
MKRLLILLFIPTLSYSQTFEDIMNMDSQKSFIKVMIENGYEKSNEYSDDNISTYSLGYIYLESLDMSRLDKMGVYDKSDDFFMISDREQKDYKIIIEKIKKNCEYYDILNNNGIDFLCYSCPQSKYSGKIGYTVIEGMGTIGHFPKERLKKDD